jgi:uncharacterized protein
MRSLALAVLAALLLLAGGRAGAAPTAGASPVGNWQGTLQGPIRLVIHVEQAPGGLRGTMDSPDQGAMGLAIDRMVFEGGSLQFEMRAVGGDFAGTMTATGDSLVGRWRQSGMEMPLTLVRTAHAEGLKRPQEPRRPLPYDTVAVRVTNPAAPGVTLAGTLTLPSGKGPFPCAILITGSGPEDRDETVFGHRPFLVLADQLTRKGIAVLRTDDRGVGQSTGAFARATSEDFASDVLAEIDFVGSRPEIDPRGIGLIGHSEGGLIAPLVANRTPSVRFVVLMAGPGIPGDSTLMLQTAAARRAMGVSEASIARELDASRRIYAGLRAGDSPEVESAARDLVRLQLDGLPEAMRRAAGDPDSLAAAAVRTFDSPWMRFFVAYDPRPALRKLQVPVLAINGERDIQVLPKENLGAIRSELAAGGNRDATVRELPGLNHLFQTCASCTVGEYGRIEETLAPVALETISKWVVAHTRVER